MIFSYVKNENGQRIGIVTAISVDSIGWSMCHMSKDKFDKDLGLRIALGRAKNGSNTSIPRNSNLISTLDIMAERAARYFKEDYSNIER